MKDLETRARIFAAQRHALQKRKDEVSPYIVHPTAVAQIVKDVGVDDPRVVAAAFLHDTVEDTDASFADINREFGQDIASYVLCLTRLKGESRESYSQRILYATPRDIQIVKLADVLHNLSTLNGIVSAEKFERARRHYQDDCPRYFLPLAERVCPELKVRIEKELARYN